MIRPTPARMPRGSTNCTSGERLPPRVRQIHGTLPALRQAIQARSQAVFEATEAFETAQRGVAGGSIRVEDWLARLNHVGQQRQALLAVVRAYNDDIADYALTVAQVGHAGGRFGADVDSA